MTRRLASDVAAQYGIPIILRLRSDLKNALRAKDLQRYELCSHKHMIRFLAGLEV